MTLRHELALICRTGTLTRESPCPLATHSPILLGLARLETIRRVLEFGCGQFSTKTFLNLAAFPHLERLDSFENDPAWFKEIATTLQGDSRIKLTFVQGEMSAAAIKTDPRKYGLVFIDDSAPRTNLRSATIRAVGRWGARLAVVHDFETFAYRRAARYFAHRYRFKALVPNTGVLWNGTATTLEQLRLLDNLIKRHRQELEPEDISGWASVFDASSEVFC